MWKLLGLVVILAAIGKPTQADLFQCVSVAQNHTLKKLNSDRFARCQDEADQTTTVGKTELLRDESQMTAQTLALVSDCFAQPYQKLFVKFYSESGLQTNIIGSRKDAGLGQLTSIAIKDVQKNANKIWAFISESQRPSCKTLTKKIYDTKPENFFRFNIDQRCHVVSGETGILRNVVFAYALHHLNEAYVRKGFADFGIGKKLIEAGLANPPIEKLIKIIVLLGYNSGAYTAAKDVSSFLDSRIDFIKRKKQELEKPTSATVAEVKAKGTAKFLSHVTKDDFNFQNGVEKYNRLLEKIKQQNVPVSLQQQALRQISVSQMGFPEWLKIWQSSGGPGYMSSLFVNAEELRSLGLSTCVSTELFAL